MPGTGEWKGRKGAKDLERSVGAKVAQWPPPMIIPKRISWLTAVLLCLSCGDPAAECRRVKLGDSASTYSDHVEVGARLSRVTEAPHGSPASGEFETGPVAQDYCCDVRIADGGLADNPQCMGVSCEGLGAAHAAHELTAPYSYDLADDNSPDPIFCRCMIGVRDGSVSSIWLRRYQD